MNGQAIAAAALAAAGLRRLATEIAGPRPAGTPAGRAAAEPRQAEAEHEGRRAAPTQP